MRNIQSVNDIPARKPKTRAEMVKYLLGHFRYDTMNSWNAATSYAICVKLGYIDFPDRETENRAYELLEVESAFYNVNAILREFAERHDYKWQMGFNGRSGGYIVLYEGYSKPSEYKRECLNCGQLNYRADSTKCGHCGDDASMVDYAGKEIGTYPGRGLDMGETFEDWDMDTLKWRVNVVWDFDQTVKHAVKAFVDFAKTHKAKEKRVPTYKTVKVAEGL